MTSHEPAAELDAMHDRARAAFLARDLDGYREIFAPALSYRQADGRVIDRDQLMRDVADQLRRFDRVRSSFTREHLDVGAGGDRATETLTQEVAAGVTVFVVVHRAWRLTRRARYAWARREGRWQIDAVEVLEERPGPGGFAFGLRPPTL